MNTPATSTAAPSPAGDAAGPRAASRRALLCWAGRGALALPAAGLGTLLAGCAAVPGAPADAARTAGAAERAAAFDAWAEDFAADWVRLSPERATFTQYFGGAEQAQLERQLSPRTAAQRRRQRDLARAGLARVEAFAPATLPPAQRTDAATLRWSLQRTLAAQPFEGHGFVFNQLGGPQVQLPSFMAETHPLRRAIDAEAYLERLRQVPLRLDEAIALARDAAARGLLPPRFIAERARAQVAAFLALAPQDTPFVAALARRSANTQGLDAAARAAAVARAQALVEDGVRPAYARVAALLDELLPRTGDDAGLWRLPDGAAAYAQALATHTTTDMDADAIHRIGLREVARLEREMDAVLRRLGHAQGTVNQRVAALRLALQPPAEPDPRPMLIERFGAYVRDAQQRALPLFQAMPRAAVEVRRVPPLTERTASASYTTPAPDGSRPGVFWVPLPGPVFNIAGMRSLAVHEAVPGHHFQLALLQEMPELPRWRRHRIFGGGSANTEGWALYAEALAIEQGWYEGDDVSLVGALDAQLFRARRLVVDTGLHAMRWTRQQAIDYGISASEVERYVANPGQACAYMVGMLRILELREGARRALGPRFTLPAFHDVVLRAGSVPLDVLAEVVGRWQAAG